MAQNSNQNGAQTAPATQSKAIAAMKDELANSVLRRIEELQANDGLVVPKDYAVTNQMNLAWLRISEMLWEDSNKVQRPVLEVVTKASVANSLLDMVLQGMDIQKKQGYFIPIKNKASGQLELTFWRSYFGDEKLARAQGMKKVRSVVVYEGDEFEYMYTEDGETKVTKHVPSLSRIDKDKIVAAYAVTTMADGSHSTTIKTMTEIRQVDARRDAGKLACAPKFHQRNGRANSRAFRHEAHHQLVVRRMAVERRRERTPRNE